MGSNLPVKMSHLMLVFTPVAVEVSGHPFGNGHTLQTTDIGGSSTNDLTHSQSVKNHHNCAQKDQSKTIIFYPKTSAKYHQNRAQKYQSKTIKNGLKFTCQNESCNINVHPC